VTTVGVFAAIFDDDRRILCVRRAYPPFNWTLPGGRVEHGESPVSALIREVEEETGWTIEPLALIGVYAAPFKDDLVLLFECERESRNGWAPDGEIAEIAFKTEATIPSDVSPRTAARIADAFAGARGSVRVFDVDE
jgi:ADP-ribose pyrophosphatase YjhB (NUDIX family)